MNKKIEALIILALTVVGGLFVGQFIFSIFIDTTLVLLFGFRPVFAAVTTVVIVFTILKIVDSKYHFKEKGINI